MATLFTGRRLMKKDGENYKETDAEAALKGKVVALYFAAGYNNTCKTFTPKLKRFYDELSGEPFEIVFVSLDRSENDLKTYLQEAHGNWCFLNFGDKFIMTLGDRYRTHGMPAVLVIKPNGDVVDGDGREKVQGGNAPSVTLQAWKVACGV